MSLTTLFIQLHTLYHLYPYAPIIAFLFAMIIAYAAFSQQKESARYLCYVVSVVLVLCVVFAIV